MTHLKRLDGKGRDDPWLHLISLVRPPPTQFSPELALVDHILYSSPSLIPIIFSYRRRTTAGMQQSRRGSTPALLLCFLFFFLLYIYTEYFADTRAERRYTAEARRTVVELLGNPEGDGSWVRVYIYAVAGVYRYARNGDFIDKTICWGV